MFDQLLSSRPAQPSVKVANTHFLAEIVRAMSPVDAGIDNPILGSVALPRFDQELWRALFNIEEINRARDNNAQLPSLPEFVFALTKNNEHPLIAQLQLIDFLFTDLEESLITRDQAVCVYFLRPEFVDELKRDVAALEIERDQKGLPKLGRATQFQARIAQIRQIQTDIATQTTTLNRLNTHTQTLFRSVADEFIRRYPAAADASPSSRTTLATWRQFRFALMTDALARLHLLWQEHSRTLADDHSFVDLSKLIIDQFQKELLQAYLPTEIEVTDIAMLQHMQDVSIFLQSLLGGNRQVLPRSAEDETHSSSRGSVAISEHSGDEAQAPLRSASQASQFSSGSDGGALGGERAADPRPSSQRTTMPAAHSAAAVENPMAANATRAENFTAADATTTTASPTRRPSHRDSLPALDNVTRASRVSAESKFMVPFISPTLQASLIHHFTHALRNAVPAEDTDNPRTVMKHTGMNNALAVLESDVSNDTLAILLQANYGSDAKTLEHYLEIQRDVVGKKPNTFATVLLKTWENFSKESPASLMRRYVFLQQLLQAVNFKSGKNKDIVKKHLAATVYAIKEFRAVLKALYPANKKFVSSSVILKNLDRLKTLATDFSNVAELARLLAIFALDALPDNQWAQVSEETRIWLLNNTAANDVITLSKTEFLKHAANALQKQKAINQYSIGPWLAALEEISDYQPARHVSDLNQLGSQPYTQGEHSDKVNIFVFHAAHCQEDYFAQPILTTREIPEIVSAPVARLLTTENNDVAIETVEDTESAASYGKRVRLVSNLSSVQAVTLAWGGSITSKTLALMNLNDANALCAWRGKLNGERTCVARVNFVFLSCVIDGDITALIELYQSSITSKEKIYYYQAITEFADSALRHLVHEQVKLNNLQDRAITPRPWVVGSIAGDITTRSFDANHFLLTLYAIIYESLNYLQKVMAAEATQQITQAVDAAGLYLGDIQPVALLSTVRAKVKERVTGLRDDRIPHLGVQIAEIFTPQEERSVKVAIPPLSLSGALVEFGLLANQYKAFGAIITLAEQFDALHQRAQAFVRRIADVYNQHREGNVGAIGAGLFMCNPPNPHSPLFVSDFYNALKDKNITFFMQMLFTLAHHPLPEKMYLPDEHGRSKLEECKGHAAEWHLCDKIGAYMLISSDIAQIWSKFRDKGFYGNHAACEALIQHYLTETANEATVNNVILIIDFVLLHTSFAKMSFAEVEKFYVYLVAAFARLVVLANSDEKLLKNISKHPAMEQLRFAFLCLNRTGRLINVQEYESLLALKPLKKYLEKTPYKSLFINAKQQDIVRRLCPTDPGVVLDDRGRANRDDGTLLGLKMAYVLKQRRDERTQANVRVEAIRVAMDGDAHATASEDISENLKVLNKLVEAIIKICFPIGYRYYTNDPAITKATKQNYKLTFSDKPGRPVLMQLCRNKLKALLDANTLTVETLKQAMNALRAEVLQGGLETREVNSHYENMEDLPHSLLSLETKNFSAGQSDTTILGGWVKCISDEINKICQVQATALQTQSSQHVELFRSQHIQQVLEAAATDDVRVGVADDKIVPADKATAVHGCIHWLLSANPMPENVPDSVRKVIPEIVNLDQQARINDYRQKLLDLIAEDKFLYRITLIQKEQIRDCETQHTPMDECINDVLYDVDHQQVHNFPNNNDFNLSELSRFLQKFDESEYAGQYEEERNKFAWAIAEDFIVECEDDDQDARDRVLFVLNTRGYSWDKLVALGFKYYVGLSETQRAEKGIAILQAVIWLATNYLSEELINTDIFSSNSGVTSNITLIQHAVAQLGQLDVASNAMVKVYEPDGLMPMGLAVYHYIVTLAQAWMSINPEFSVLNDDQQAETVVNDTIQQASSLLARFYQLRKTSDEQEVRSFSGWHQEMLIFGKNHPKSFLYILAYGYTQDSLTQKNISDLGSQGHGVHVAEAMALQPSYTRWYTKSPDVVRQNAYVQHAEEALRLVLELPFLGDTRDTNKKEKTYSTVLEQMKLIFDAARDFCKKSDASPYHAALKALANGESIDEETVDEASIISNLFIKACVAFNTMMNPTMQKHYIINAETAALLNNAQEILRKNDELRCMYLEETAVSLPAIHSEEHAQFILELVRKSDKTISAENRKKLLEKIYTWIHVELEAIKDSSNFSTRLSHWLDELKKAECIDDYFTYAVRLSSSQYSFATNAARPEDERRSVYANTLLIRFLANIPVGDLERFYEDLRSFDQNPQTAYAGLAVRQFSSLRDYVIKLWGSYVTQKNSVVSLSFFAAHSAESRVIQQQIDFLTRACHVGTQAELPEEINNVITKFIERHQPNYQPAALRKYTPLAMDDSSENERSSNESGSSISSQMFAPGQPAARRSFDLSAAPTGKKHSF